MKDLFIRKLNNYIFNCDKNVEILVIGDSFPLLNFTSYLEIFNE